MLTAKEGSMGHAIGPLLSLINWPHFEEMYPLDMAGLSGTDKFIVFDGSYGKISLSFKEIL
jgi:hypothetical protein